MAEKEKPYKLYRGGRVKGPIRPEKDRGGLPRRDGDGAAPQGPKTPRRRRWRRTVLLLLVALVVVALVWALLGYLAVRRGVKEANERLPDDARSALTAQEGSLLTNATNVLVLGADVGGGEQREGRGRSDSIMLVRADPDENRIAYLSIPRDLRVEIPGHGTDKVNAAYSLGGPALAIDTVENLLGARLPVNHVVVVDFSSFADVVGAVGGIYVDNPTEILSNPEFDCPLPRDRCANFKGWRFREGRIFLNRRRALVYARIRENQLDPSENDVTRAERQQRVIQGIADKVVSVGGFFDLPFNGDDLVKPLATDLSTGELLSLAWVRWRAADDKTLRCRLGGDPAGGTGGFYIEQSSEDNALVVATLLGESGAQRPTGGPLSPGCFTGRAGG